MFSVTSLIRFRRLLLVGTVVAVVIVPAAMAVGRPPDVQEAASASANRIAQTSRTSEIGNAAVGDVIERYVATHQSLAPRPPDIQDAAAALSSATPDLVERFVSIHPYGLASMPVSRPPDISDTALAIRYGSATADTTSFNWHDWAIGIASGLGLALLLGFTILMARQLRHRAQTV